jgi:hypothetical protein
MMTSASQEQTCTFLPGWYTGVIYSVFSGNSLRFMDEKPTYPSGSSVDNRSGSFEKRKIPQQPHLSVSFLCCTIFLFRVEFRLHYINELAINNKLEIIIIHIIRLNQSTCLESGLGEF